MRAAALYWVLLSFMITCSGQEFRDLLHEQARIASLTPVRPGIPGKQPFWNQYAMRFIHAPAFDFKELPAAAFYRFTAISFTSMDTYVFRDAHPWSPLTPIWDSLPVGEIFLKVEGIGPEGRPAGLSGERKCYRAAPFQGPYHAAKKDYFSAGKQLLDHIFHLDLVQHWMIKDAPDPAYTLNAYPSKIIASTISAMLRYAELNALESPESAAAAITIATRAADYLIGESEPAGTALAHLPPTYSGDEVAAGANRGRIMTNMCARAGQSYLDLYDATQQGKYLQAALDIAEKLVEIQLPQGVWPIKIQTATGQMDTQNYGIPIGIIRFLDRLIADFSKTRYRYPRDRAWRWILEHPMKTYHWEGQFEDVQPGKDAYRLMGMPDACLVAGYLLEHRMEDPGYLDKALELICFVEDQFVVWERPLPYGQQGEPTNTWFIPSVLEQYTCYTPIDACVTMVSKLFYQAYQATQKALFLEKSRALANSLTQKQDRNGNIPTGWDTVPPTRIRYWWLNCATADALFLLDYQPPL